MFLDKYKCYNCCKIFKDNKDLLRHKNRKTPCLIREVAGNHISNPNRCIYCNKIFANIGNKNKHLKHCKIKNGGMDILDEKIRYEQEIRILKEQHALDKKELCEKINEQASDFQKQLSEIKEELHKHNAMSANYLKESCNNSNPVINVTNNIITQNNITINLHNYDNPKTDTIMLTREDLTANNLNKKIIELLYFNEALPENHVIYRPNIREHRLLIYKDNAWKHIIGDELIPIFINIKNCVYIIGRDKINNGQFYKNDEEFLQLPPGLQTIIRNFNVGEQIADVAIMETITENREIVKNTMMALKLI